MTLEFVIDAGFGIVGIILRSSYPSRSSNWNSDENPPPRLSGRYSASRNERTLAEVLEDGNTLNTGAYYVDEVEEVLPMPFTPSLSDDKFREILYSFQGTDWESRKRMLVRTLSADTDGSGRLSEEKVVEWTKAQLIWPSE